MKAVLLTGASGFLGENIAHRFHREPCKLYLVYNKHAPRADGEKKFHVDIEVRGRFSHVLRDLQVDTVVHTAAITDPDACQRNPGLAHAVNIAGTCEVAEWAEQQGARMIYVSTDLVYDGEKSPYREEDPPFPTNAYGKTKLEGEEQVQSISTNWVIIRLALSYGPTRGVQGDWTSKMRTALKEGRDLTLFTDQFRTPAYAGDTAEAIYRFARGKGQGIYHMGGRERVSRYTFGKKFAEIFQLPEKKFLPIRMADLSMDAPRARDCSLVTAKITKDLGLRLCNVSEGLQQQQKEEAHI